MPERIDVVGLLGGAPVGADAGAALAAADVVVGGAAQLRELAGGRTTIELQGGVEPALDRLAAVDGWVVVVASGDPGFFGIVRALAERFGPEALVVHPAPSSVSLAFARLGLPWDDALVVSAHGRPLDDAVRAVAAAGKIAVLTGPDAPPEALGRALLAAGTTVDRAVVCSHLAEQDESITSTDLEGLATGRWPHRSVVVLLRGVAVAAAPTDAWPSRTYDTRAGMITKPEVRAVAVHHLAVPDAGVLWDVGAGSGSVAIECALAAPALRVIAVERDPADAERIRANAAMHGAAVDVVVGEAPAALEALPDPDRAFVGGGGLGVLDAVLGRLHPDGRVVATYAAVDRATEAWRRLGHLVEVSIARATPIGETSVRLAGENPVFVVWGPR